MISCQEKTEIKPLTERAVIVSSIKKKDQKKKPLDAAAILAKKEVPILCYHRIKDFPSEAGEMTKTYTVKPSAFAEQMKALSEAGYQTILPDQLFEYLAYDKDLPAKPVMITFDDTHEEQYSIGFSELKKYNFKGAFFIMTVSINRPNYLSKEQIIELDQAGNSIGAHTWDHHMVTKYSEEDWNTQLVKPKTKLEGIISKPINNFAYPFGLWNEEAISQLKNSGYQMAFILSTKKRDSMNPLFTIRRMIVSGEWSTERMLKTMEKSFQ